MGSSTRKKSPAIAWKSYDIFYTIRSSFGTLFWFILVFILLGISSRVINVIIFEILLSLAKTSDDLDLV